MAQISLPVPAKVGLTFDVRLLIVLLTMSLVASVLFTVLSAWKGLRSDPRAILSASAVTLAPHSRAHSILVVAQVALGCVTLTAGALLARSAWSVAHVDVGFDPANGVIGRVVLFDQGYKADSGGAFYESLQENLAQVPGVNAVALGWHAPVSAMRATSRFTIPGSPDPLQTRYDVVGPDYFATLDVAVRAGREFDARDRGGRGARGDRQRGPGIATNRRSARADVARRRRARTAPHRRRRLLRSRTTASSSQRNHFSTCRWRRRSGRRPMSTCARANPAPRPCCARS